MNEWTRASLDSPWLKLGPPKLRQTAWDCCWGRTSYTLSGDISAFLRRHSFNGPRYFSVGFFFFKLFLLCYFERPGFCYSQTSGLIKLTMCLLGALLEMSIVPRAVPKNSYQLPTSIIQKLLLKTSGEAHTFGKGWTQSCCYSNFPEILHELFGSKLVLWTYVVQNGLFCCENNCNSMNGIN